MEVYDNAASSNATAAPADETAFTYWLAEAPVTADAQQGLVAVGNDEEFERVLVKAGTKAAFPADCFWRTAPHWRPCWDDPTHETAGRATTRRPSPISSAMPWPGAAWPRASSATS